MFVTSGEWAMEGASVAILITVQKIYYPFLCIMGIPGPYLNIFLPLVLQRRLWDM